MSPILYYFGQRNQKQNLTFQILMFFSNGTSKEKTTQPFSISEFGNRNPNRFVTAFLHGSVGFRRDFQSKLDRITHFDSTHHAHCIIQGE